MKDPRALHLSLVGRRPYQWRAYIARPITALRDVDKDFVDGLVDVIDRVCERHQIEPYDPDNVSGVSVAPSMSPEEVYLRDSAQVLRATVLFAICTPRCEGVPMEIQLAGLSGIPVVLIHRSKWQGEEHRISRMVLGSPARIVDVLSLSGHKGAEKRIEAIIPKVILAMERVKGDPLAGRNSNGMGVRVRDRRMQMRMSEEELAGQLGVSTEYVKTLEGAGVWKSLSDKEVLCPEEHAQPSLRILKRLARILELDLDWLIRGLAHDALKEIPLAALKSQKMESSLRNLNQLLNKGLKAEEFTHLWVSHLVKSRETEKVEGLEVAARDLPVVEVSEWHRRLKTFREGPQLFET